MAAALSAPWPYENFAPRPDFRPNEFLIESNFIFPYFHFFLPGRCRWNRGVPPTRRAYMRRVLILMEGANLVASFAYISPPKILDCYRLAAQDGRRRGRGPGWSCSTPSGRTQTFCSRSDFLSAFSIYLRSQAHVQARPPPPFLWRGTYAPTYVPRRRMLRRSCCLLLFGANDRILRVVFLWNF